MINLLVAILSGAIVYAVSVLYAGIGETFTERSGVMNLGVEGIMYMGGAIGLGGVFYYEKIVGAGNANVIVAFAVAILFALLAGALASLIFSFITITLRANQNVAGLTLTIFGGGLMLKSIF